MLIESKKYRGFFDVPGAPGYLVNRSGEFILAIDGSKINVGSRKVGVLTVNFKINGRWIKRSVARIIAKLFVDVPTELSNQRDTLLIDYVDGDRWNVAVDNLIWVTSSELQKVAFKRKIERFRQQHPGSIADGKNDRYPYAIECFTLPGYYYLPNLSNPVVISKLGQIVNLETGAEHHTRVDKKGYLTTALYNQDQGRYIQVKVHRLVARLFSPIPPRHSERAYDDLQVNHLDGDKLNNYYENLEWVTNVENMDHARKAGLFSNEITVLAKNIQTEEISRYVSISECARTFLMSASVLCKHLKSSSAGMIPKESHVFKLDDDSPWPNSIAEVDTENGFYAKCDVVAKT